MSRSHKKRPFFAWAGGENGQKWWKQQYNQNMRRKTNMLCHEMTKGALDPDEITFPVIDEGLGDVWCSPKDGTNHYWSLAEAIVDDARWDSWCHEMGYDNSHWRNRNYVENWHRGMRK